jgi:membrane protease YdiL (CAAX protease family)
MRTKSFEHILKDYFSKNTDLISGSMVILSCLLLALFFPVQNLIQTATRDIAFFIIIPSIYIRFILKKPLSDFGLNLKDKKTGFFWFILMTLFLFFTFYFLTAYTGFSKEYKIHEGIIGNFHWFIFYELVLINIIIFIQEFFFRGLVLFLFSGKIGAWAIAIQGILNIALIASDPSGQRLSWPELPLSVVAISSGIVAYKSKSFMFSYFSALLFHLLLDSYIIYNMKSLVNI